MFKENLGKPKISLILKIENDKGYNPVVYESLESIFGNEGKCVTDKGYLVPKPKDNLLIKQGYIDLEKNVEDIINLDLIINYRDKSNLEDMPKVYFRVKGEEYFAHAENKNIVIANYGSLFS